VSKPQPKNVDNPFEARQVYEALQELQCKKSECIIAVEGRIPLSRPGELPITTGSVRRQCEPIRHSLREDWRIKACPKNAI